MVSRLLTHEILFMAARALSVASIHLVPYGVLGASISQRSAAGREPFSTPEKSIAFVDPAGLPFVQQIGPGGAGGASGANYAFLGINMDPAFPDDVVSQLTEECHAKHHVYTLPNGKTANCIHVIGPNFNGRDPQSTTYDVAVKELSRAYLNVLLEFDKSGNDVLRLLPISGGIFAGDFANVVPKLAKDAVAVACEELEPEASNRLASKRIEMCIFVDAEFEAFVSTGWTPDTASQ
jgi:hypothetical protein